MAPTRNSLSFCLWFCFCVFSTPSSRKSVRFVQRSDWTSLSVFHSVLTVRKTHRDQTPSMMYVLSSFTYLSAMLTSNYALEFVSYPMQVLGKSVKPVPVMLLGVLVARKKYSSAKYFYVLLVVLGKCVFVCSSIEVSSGSSSRRDSVHVQGTQRTKWNRRIECNHRDRRVVFGKISNSWASDALGKSHV